MAIKKRQMAEKTLQTHLDKACELAREHQELATSLSEEARRREGAEMHLRQQRDQLKCHAEQMECLHAIGGATDRDSADIKTMLDGTLKHLRAYYRDVDRVWLRIEIDECTVQRGQESDESRDCRMEIPIRSAHRSIGNLQVSVGIGEDGVEAARTRARDIDFLKLVGDKIGKAVERQRAMITLRSSEEQRTKMADAAHDAFIMIDDRGAVTFWNRAAEQIFGLPRDEALGEALHEIIVPKPMMQQHQQQFAKYCRTGQGPVVGKTVELEARRKNGELFPAELSLSSVRIDGRWHAIGIVRDITERKEADRTLQEKEHQLRQSQKMEAVGVLAGGIAHEFNNLLQVICGYTEFALRDLPSDAPVVNDLSRVMAAGRRAASLTRQLLDFSRREPVTGSRLDLNRAAQEVISMLKPITTDQVHWEFHPDPALPAIYGDSGALEQALMNLCVNSRDAMPDGGTIALRTESVTLNTPLSHQHGEVPAGDYVRVIVSDTGKGMPDYVAAKIFDPFFTTKEVGKGTGLGLSTVVSIVEQHQGAILVESELGVGTTFQIYFPICSDESGGPADETAPTDEDRESLLV